MKTLRSATKSEVQLLMDFDYNNVLGRIKYVLGKEASLFSDILIKNSEIHWMVKDDSSYVSLTELSSVVQSEVKGALSGRISYVSEIIAGDSLIGAYSDKILSFPSDEYVFVKEGKGDGDIVLTGWGCKSLSHDSLHTSETTVKTMVDEPVKEEATNSEYIESSPTPKNYIAETADAEKQESVSAEELQTIGNDTLIKDSAVSDVTIETDVSGDTKYTSEWLKSNTEIHGWLSFFFFAIIVGGLISAIYPVATYNAADYGYNGWLGVVDIITGLSLFGIAIYTVYAFTHRKPNAVFYGSFYVILVFVTNIISLFGGVDENGLQNTTQVVRGIIWGVVWFLYLLFSKQVQEVIPKSFRKVSGLDWGVLIALIGIPFACFFIGFSQLNGIVEDREDDEAEILSVVLQDNERTDGKVIFSVPSGFSCESQESETGVGQTITVFNLENESIGSISLCSDYDSDTSTSNFDDYWKNWEDTDASGKPRTDVDRGLKTINGNTCRYRIVKYDFNGVQVYWRYYIIFSSETTKCCVVSCYDKNEDTSYVSEILNSVRFK